MSVSTSGVAANDPNRQAGSWNQTVGAGKEMVGGALGMEGMKKEGQEQNAQGKAVIKYMKSSHGDGNANIGCDA